MRKYDARGRYIWSTQFGTITNDFGYAIAIDPDDNFVVAGNTAGGMDGTNQGNFDVYLRKFDPEGNTLWTRQFGTVATDLVQSVAVSPSGLIVLAGNTGGSLSGASNGSMDMFIRTYHPNGDHDKTVQFGSSAYDSLNGVATDPSGNIFVTGYTGGALTGSNAGMNDAFLIKFLPNGTLDWTRQFGTEADDNSLGVATDASGMVYLTGHTRGDLVVTNAGQQDVFVRSYSR